MHTKIIKIDKNNFKAEDLKEAASIIKEGGLVAFPTETVYGLGANGLEKSSIKKIYKAKGRPSDNPLILHIGKKDGIYPLVKEVPDLALELIEEFWPGPLTIILEKSDLVPGIITGGLETVAIRMPQHPIARRLIELSGVPIAAPSANISGKPSPTSGRDVIEDMDGKIAAVIDGGPTGIGLESTVLDLSGEKPMVLRPGGIGIEELRRVAGDVGQDDSILDKDKLPKSPGQKYRHYAPEAEMVVFKGSLDCIIESINDYVKESPLEDEKIGIMATDESKDHYSKGIVKSLGSREDKRTIALNLFKTIREFDRIGVDVILSEGVKLDDIGMAIMNRMMKASGGKSIDC